MRFVIRCCVSGLAVVAGLGSVVASASPMLLDYDARNMDLDVDLTWKDSEGIFHHEGDRNLFVPGTSFEDWSATGELVAGTIALNSSQVSSVSDLLIAGSGSITGIGAGPSSDGAVYHRVETRGINMVMVLFSITEATAFSLDATLHSSGPTAGSEILIRGRNGTAFHYIVQTGEGAELVGVSEKLVLEAGSYEFVMDAIVINDDLEYNAHASFDGQFRVIPAPSGLVLLAGGGLLTVRRRR